MPILVSAPRRALRCPGHPVEGGPAGRTGTMAKGQQKSNREAKKPKKEKPKTPATANAGASATLDRIKNKKK